MTRIMNRRTQVAEMYQRGFTLAYIAAHLACNIATVHKDLREIRQAWVEEQAVNFDEARAVELARLDNLEMLAMQAYERSCLPREERRTKLEMVPEVKVKEKQKGKDRSDPSDNLSKKLKAAVDDLKSNELRMVTIKEVSDTYVVNQIGDPRFLTIIRECIEARCKLRGLLKEEPKQGGGGTVININLDGLAGVPESNESEDVDPVESKIKQLTEAVPDAEIVEGPK